ncbi:MAG: hypothetical protein R3283_06525 [Balneolaceae bacterium]|nr:hypothetical protein [Balneolaceae bacterium]
MPHNPLDHASLADGVSFLSDLDPDLEKVISKFGHPPLWSREPGFSTLVHIILEQQVSLASAKAAFNKWKEASESELTPDRFLRFSDAELKGFGFSRQKTEYCRELAKAVSNGDLELDKLHELDDMEVRRELIRIKGIGNWTASIYLLMALLRPDVWPSGDLALKNGIQEIKNLSEYPDSEKCEEIAVQWKPWRAVAARIVWHHYLCRSIR